MEFAKFPAEVFAGMTFAAVFCLLLFIGLAVAWKLKNKGLKVLWPVAAGALGFFVFAMILEQLLHIVMLPLVQNNVWLLSLYGALAAGLFEETARFLIFKFVLKKHIADGDPRHAISYGIGHGGIEAVLVVSVSMLSMILIGILINSGNGAMLTLGMGEAELELLKTQLDGVATQGFGMYLVSCFERICAVVFHISLSVVVYRAVTAKKYWLYPMAILLHALLDVPAAMYQTGVITNIFVLEALIALFVAVVTVFVVMMYKKMKKEHTSEITQ